MTNCFKKHWFLIIGILLLSNYSIGQSFLSIPDGLVKPNGRPFKVRLNPTSSIAEQCTSQTITLDIGALEYLPGSNGPLPSGIVVTPLTANGKTVLTITGIVNDGKQGISLLMDIAVQFKAGTCDEITQKITATTTNVGCPIISDQIGEATVLSRTPNNAKTTIYLSKSISEPVCPGKVISYKVYVENPGNQGFNIKNAKVNIELDKCATVVGIYKNNTYMSVNPTISVSNNIQYAIFDTPDLLLSPYSSTTVYDLYVTYPCLSGNGNDCVTGPKKINAYLTGNKADCGLDIEIVKSSVSTNTSVNTATCGNVNCSSGGGGGGEAEPVYLIVNSSMPCPSCPSSDPILAVSLNVPPLNPSFTDRVVTLDIPTGYFVTGAYSYYYNGCNSNYQIRYVDAQGNKQATPFTGSLTRQVEFFTDCAISVPYSYWQVQLKYDPQNLPQAGQNVPVNVKFTSGGTIISNGTFSAYVNTCTPNLTTYNQIRKVNQPRFENNYNVSAIPGESMTYRFQLMNNGTSDSNNNIRINIDQKLIYEGGFKYAYDDLDYYYDKPMAALEGKASFTVPELGTVNVSTPIIGEAGIVNLSGFNFPCTKKNLYIEFTVRPKDNVVAGNTIPISTTMTGAQGTWQLNPNIITILSYTYVKSKMFVKCSLADEWNESGIDVRNGEVVDFKMQFSNAGSTPVVLSELVNLRPQVGDLFEFGSNARNSTLNIDYNCDLPLVFTNAVKKPSVNFNYALNSPTMDRNILCPVQSSGNLPNWIPSCDSANWLRATFLNSFTLAPGEFVEVTYKGRVAGSTGKAFNSFAFKVDGCNLVSANSNALAIKNNGDEGIGCNSCTLTNVHSADMKKLFENLLNNVITRKINGETDAQINGSAPSELLALIPYMTNGGGDKIYNFVSTLNAQNKITSIKFSFSPTSDGENDVIFIEEKGLNYNPEVGSVDPSYLKIDTTLYGSSSQYLTTCRKDLNSNGTVISECNSKTQVRHIDFCPKRFCYPMSGEIKTGESNE